MLTNKIIFDALPDPVFLLDRGRNVVYANASAQDIFECRAEGGDLATFIRHPTALGAIDRVRGGTRVYTAEISFPVPVARTFQLHAARVDSDPVAAVIMFSDMTSAVRAEQMRVDFVNNASHELRSPLTAILGSIETMQGPARGDAEATQKFLASMAREAERMRRLINDLLSLARVEDSEHVRPRGRARITTVFDSVLDILESRVQATHTPVAVNMAKDLPDLIGDTDQLVQVFRNLLENALIHGGAGKPVAVSVETVPRIPETDRAGILVKITDHGDGVQKDLIPRLTERFYRVDDVRSSDHSDNPGSTGLGLAIVKHIINRHRGCLQINSEHGQGSTFSVFLPVHAEDPPEDHRLIS